MQKYPVHGVEPALLPLVFDTLQACWLIMDIWRPCCRGRKATTTTQRPQNDDSKVMAFSIAGKAKSQRGLQRCHGRPATSRGKTKLTVHNETGNLDLLGNALTACCCCCGAL